MTRVRQALARLDCRVRLKPDLRARLYPMLRPLLTGLAVTALPLPAAAQDKKAVQLRWFGHSYFLLVTTAGTKVAFDPHAIADYGVPPQAPDILLMSHNHNDHNRR